MFQVLSKMAMLQEMATGLAEKEANGDYASSQATKCKASMQRPDHVVVSYSACDEATTVYPFFVHYYRLSWRKLTMRTDVQVCLHIVQTVLPKTDSVCLQIRSLGSAGD